MLTSRKAEARGVTRIDWLDSRHSFSFGEYYDPKHMGFRSLRVINEDRVRAGSGFPTHSHRDMEIVSYVLEGELQHKDSLGNGSIIRPGEVQRMSAGKGITHSEYNPSKTESVHFLQIWILPDAAGIAPGYEQQAIDLEAAKGKFHVIASREGGPGAVKIHQDASMLVSILRPGDTLTYPLPENRYGWLQVARGAIVVNDSRLEQGDGASVDAGSDLKIESRGDSEILLFNLA